jgi:hypothetical protein
VTFGSNGTNAAKNTTATFTKAGTYNFQVTIKDGGGLTTTSTVSVTVNQTLTSIAVSPASATVNTNATQPFIATAKDQFGDALVIQPALTWSVASGGGSVNSSGLYAAPAAAGSATVRAANGAVSGTASVTIVAITSAKLSGAAIGTSGSWKNQGNTVAKVFDGSLTTFFDAPTAGGAWAGLDLGSAQVIDQIKFAPRTSFASRMVGGKFQASNSANFASGVVDLYTVSTAPTQGVLTTVTVSNATAFRYVRYLGPSGGYCNIAEAQFFGHAPPGSPTAAKVTGAAIGTAGSQNNSGNTIAKVFDGSFSTFFDAPTANGAWVGLDLGTAKTITQLKFAPRAGFESRMVNGSFQVSNVADFSTATTVSTITSAPLANTLTTVNVSVVGTWRFVRYVSPAGTYGNIAELEIWGY